MTSRSDAPAPAFFLGTVPIQSPGTHATLDAYYDAGGRDLDTARVYGASEQTIGEWIARRGIADDIRVLTKGACPVPGDARPRLTRADIFADADRSLELLGLERVETYLLHRDDPAIPADDVAEILTTLVARGATRRIGVSNWTAERVRLLAGALDRGGGPPLAYVSNYFGLGVVRGRDGNPGVRTASPDLHHLAGAGQPRVEERLAKRDASRNHRVQASGFETRPPEAGAPQPAGPAELGFRILAWSPLSAGYFASRTARGPHTHDNPESERRRDLLHDIAERNGVDAVAVLARWVVTVSPVVVPVFGCSTSRHVDELVRYAADAALDAPVAELNAALGAGALDCGEFDD